jgi:glycine/D-amino acid oxidase-like deaminating enzyme
LTAPAPDLLEEIGWTHDGSVSDYRAALHYVRPTVDGRLAFGIGGYQPGLAKRIGPKFAYDDRPMRIALEDFHRMFPSFAEVPIEAAWGGPIDVAAHHIPHFGTFDRGTVAYGHGYTGNGVGPAHLGGRILAAMALRADEPDLFALPVVTEQPMRFPPEPIRTPGALVANEAIRRRDEAGDRGERPNPLTDFVAKLPRRVGYNLGP